MKFIIKILYTAICVLVISSFLPGVHVDNLTVSVFVALVLAFLNAFCKPLLVIFTIPITILSLGLFLLVINAVIILFADYLIEGFEVKNFWWALLFSLILSFAVSFFDKTDKR